MQVLCDHCGKRTKSQTNFCPYCGAEAPRKTIIFNQQEEKLKKPKYCPDCSKPNISDAMYCSDCGERLHKKPIKEVIFCGDCGEKNKSIASVCCSCGMSFTDWFSMKGKIAQRYGYKGNLKLTEKMNGTTYFFSSNPIFTIGRKKENDLIIPCSWVSGDHCRIDLQKKILIDSSKNGTFINRSPERIQKESLSFISEINIAGLFTFSLLKKEHLYCLHLGAILDEEECRRNGDGDSFDKLRKCYYLLCNGDFQIDIQKLDGAIPVKRKTGVAHYSIIQESGYYYYTDIDRDIEKVLFMKENNIIPDHWSLELF